jgi:hypothetical protein
MKMKSSFGKLETDLSLTKALGLQESGETGELGSGVKTSKETVTSGCVLVDVLDNNVIQLPPGLGLILNGPVETHNIVTIGTTGDLILSGDSISVGTTNMINWGGSNADTVSGKNQVTGRANGDDVMGLYWAIQDQTKTWWELDHVVVQNIYQDTTAGDSFLARLNNAAEFTGLTALL